jgi:hypothetical protein
VSKDVPVPGAAVKLMCGAAVCGTARTDSDGQFAFKSVPPGTHTIRVDKIGYYPQQEAGFEVTKGMEAVAKPVFIERCASGDCNPNRRPQKPPALCE